MRAFAQAERFVSEVKTRKLRPAYVFVGDEVFFRKRCREAILEHLVPPDLRDFSLFEFDLAETELVRSARPRAHPIADGAIPGVLCARREELSTDADRTMTKFAAIEAYCKDPNPDALLIFVADHISIPADARRMDMTDKDRYERIRDTLGEYCGIVELARVEEGEAVRWIGEYARDSGREDRCRRRARTGGRARRRHDDGLQ